MNPHAPFAPLTTQTLAMVPIIPKHVWEEIEDPSKFDNIPAIGSGTYKFDYWKKGQEFKVSRFDDYFQPADNEGVLVVFFGTAEAAYTALFKDEVDVIDRVLSHQIPEIEDNDSLQFVAIPSNGSITLVVNLRNKPYDDPQFRLALSLAIPRERILAEFYEGYGNVAGSVIAPANELEAELRGDFDKRFAARAEASGERLVLSLSGDLATVPYSAEDARSRTCLFQFLAWLGDMDSCRLAVIGANTVRYHGSVEIAPSFTAADVVTGAVTLLLRARPYIEIMEELR
ncbi:MAG: hypothetical protein IH861_16735, partial [Chloroflexi bacterium]|nr:hypothetical protein [Chloroflexota bacterium]